MCSQGWFLSSFSVSSMQQAHVSSLEDKLHSVLTSQRELQLLSCQQRRTISDLRFKTNQLSTESEGLRSKIEQLEQVGFQ